MTVGNRLFAGKGAREEAATALTFAILTWRDDQSLQSRGVFRGFEILSKGKTGGFQSQVPYNHYSLLATVEAEFGLGYLANAADRQQVQPMTEFLTK